MISVHLHASYFVITCLKPTLVARLTLLVLKQLELRSLNADLIFIFKLTQNIASSTLSHALHFANNNIIMGRRYKLFISRYKNLFLKLFYQLHRACLEVSA